MLPDRPLLALTMIALADLGGLVLLLMVLFSGWIIWLMLMKPLFTRNEMSNYLGLESAKQSRAKRLVKRIFDLVY